MPKRPRGPGKAITTTWARQRTSWLAASAIGWTSRLTSCLSKLRERLTFNPGSDWTFSTSSGKTFEKTFVSAKGGKLQHLGAFIVGIVVGFLGGLFGKGGSAIATPLLSLIGYPGFIAVASPLPATIPGTLAASGEYWQSHLLDWQIVWWSIAVGVPATILGSYLTKYTGPRPLLIVTGILVLGFGLSFLFLPRERQSNGSSLHSPPESRPSYWRLRLVLIATGVGIVSGLLANAGGFLLAPAYARFLKQPIKKSFACSLAVAAVLAVPGTIVHACLGHISWTVTGLVALGSVPFSYLGARIAIRTKASRLERIYGIVLTALGTFFLYQL